MSYLSDKKCIPCSGAIPPLPVAEREQFKKELHPDWEFKADQNKLFRAFKYNDYLSAWQLVNKISELAEEEWHHPEITFGWGHLEVEVWTHKINSLVESDFVFAAKIDKLTLD